MAYVGDVNCTECNTKKREVVHPMDSSTCNSCRHKKASKKKRLHLASLKGLTVEERLDRIEEVLYDTNADRRLKGLEAENQTYA